MGVIVTSSLDVLVGGGYIQGILFVDDLLSDGSYQVDLNVSADIENSIGALPTDRFSVGFYTVLFLVTGFDPNRVSLFSGNPQKRKFGQIAHSGVGYVADQEFLFFSPQALKMQKMRLEPLPTPFANNESELPALTPVVDFLYSSSRGISDSGGVISPAGIITGNIDWSFTDSVEARFIIEYGVTVANQSTEDRPSQVCIGY